ncbi:MAG: hypothetical protein KDA45_14180, partial [Planctomycetales bacterium]|nr:hypothetical protein [Planctomycetales bacterium]
FTPVGFLLGMVLATVPLLILAHKLTPAAGGKPLPDEDEQPQAEEDDLPPPTTANRSKPS